MVDEVSPGLHVLRLLVPPVLLHDLPVVERCRLSPLAVEFGQLLLALGHAIRQGWRRIRHGGGGGGRIRHDRQRRAGTSTGLALFVSKQLPKEMPHSVATLWIEKYARFSILLNRLLSNSGYLAA